MAVSALERGLSDIDVVHIHTGVYMSCQSIFFLREDVIKNFATAHCLKKLEENQISFNNFFICIFYVKLFYTECTPHHVLYAFN